MNNHNSKPDEYTCVSNLDKEAKDKLNAGLNTHRLPFCSIEIPTNLLSHDGHTLYHVVEATKQKNAKGKPVLKLRILIKECRGVTVTIPYTDTLHQRYLDLRYLIRNCYAVHVRFPNLYVQGSVRPHELMLIAYNFNIIYYE
jgi:hypothetical protein